MSEQGIRKGDEIVVVVYQNKVSVGEIIIDAISNNEVAAAVYTDDGDTLLTVKEALSAALGCANFHVQKTGLKGLLDARIKELKDMIAREEGDNPPSPADGDTLF